jgi:hydroxyacylglutathione hydrolase
MELQWLLTHHHQDHTVLANELAEVHDAIVLMSKTEIDFYGFHCSKLMALQREGYISLGSIKVDVLFTPGHTAGSQCYHISNTKDNANVEHTGWLFTGDTLFVEGCGVCIDRGSSSANLFDSLQKLKLFCDESTLIYAGHSFGLPVGQTYSTVKENNIYLAISNKEQFVLYRDKSTPANIMNFTRNN